MLGREEFVAWKGEKNVRSIEGSGLNKGRGLGGQNVAVA